MVKSRTFIILVTLIFGVIADHKNHLHARHNGYGESSEEKPCTNNPNKYGNHPPCSTPKPTTSEETSSSSTTKRTSISTDASTTSSTDDPTALERAHWCRMSNGTYLALNYKFINSKCSLCQCMKGHNIRCQLIECMPTYCLDNSMPHREAGQCCTKCRTDIATNTTCLYDDIEYPHGSLLKSVEGKMQCWCQLGNIECRTYMGTLMDSLDVLASGATVYIILIIIFVVLIMGSLFCCGITLIVYYYYHNNQQKIQHAYDQYINDAGWQPLEESEADFINDDTEKKDIEAEKYQYESYVSENGPPPYSSEQEQKQL
jgi:hypothetical protein